MKQILGMKNLLMVFNLLPYPLRAHGVSVRYLPIINHLSKKYKIDIILITGKEAEIKDSDALRTYCNNITIIQNPREFKHNIFEKLKTSYKFIIPWNPPSTFISHNGRSVTEGIKKATHNRCYTTVIWVGHYLLPNLISALPSISTDRVIVDFIDSPSLWAKRTKEKTFKFDLLEKYEIWKILKWESIIINKVNSVIYISNVDAKTIPPSFTPGKIRHVIPNGINIDNYTKEKYSYIPSPNIGFLGNMSYGPNIEAVHWLYEKVFIPLKRKTDNISLIIIGRDPVQSIQELGMNPGVTVTGTVADIWPYINSIDMFVFPILTGAGMKNKILEVMYAEKPVLTTHVGNEGIDAGAEHGVRICQTPDEFQTEVIRMLANSDERKKLGHLAHQFIEEKYSWENILNKYEALVNGNPVSQ